MCYRANAAFTLYGVKSGASDHGCHEKTYINSFLTTTGVGALMSAIEEAGSYTFNTAYGDGGGDDGGGDDDGAIVVTAECSSDFYHVGDDDHKDDDGACNGDDAVDDAVDGDEDGDEDGNDDGACGDDDDDDDQPDDHATRQHLYRMYQDATSYTVGCFGKDFSYNSFQGAYCDGSWTTGVVHKLSSFNEEIKSVGCVAIYDAANGIDAATELLSNYADACSLRQYPDRCPDPYGKLKKYTNRIEGSTGSLTTTLRKRFLAKSTMWLAYIIGIFLMIASCYVTGKAVQGSESKRSEMGISDSIVSLDVTKNPIKLVGVGVVKTASLMKERVTSFAEATKDGIKEEPTIDLPTIEETPSEGDAPAETFKDESFTTGRKYKRPRLARLSKRLFRKKNKA